MRSQRRSARGTVGHAYSALNLRLLLASFGFVAFVVLAIVSAVLDQVALAIFLAGLALVAAINVVVVQRRRRARRREEPGVKHSLFE